MEPLLYLASLSPRRRELLAQIGIPHRQLVVEIDESPRPGETPEGYVVRLAVEKAAAGWTQVGAQTHLPVLAADTAVVVDGEILGKPSDREDAGRMLQLLSGRGHLVMTGVALAGAQTRTAISVSRVDFRNITEQEAAAYWESGEPLDKAGGYAVQGRGALFISHLEGSYSGVMGLPLFETGGLLREAGVPVIAGWLAPAP